MRKPGIEWVAGFLEGEGSFAFKKCGTLQIQAAQVQREPLLRLLLAVGGYIYDVTPKQARHQAFGMWCVSGKKAADVMRLIYRHMSPRRREQIRMAMRAWMARPGQSPACRNGHQRNGNTRLISGRRRCLACGREANRRYLAARAA